MGGRDVVRRLDLRFESASRRTLGQLLFVCGTPCWTPQWKDKLPTHMDVDINVIKDTRNTSTNAYGSPILIKAQVNSLAAKDMLPLTLALTLAAVAAAQTLSPSVQHSKRSQLPSGWSRVRRHASDAVLPLRFGLTQPNVDFNTLQELLTMYRTPNPPTTATTGRRRASRSTSRPVMRPSMP